jgi:hypothetical protein
MNLEDPRDTSRDRRNTRGLYAWLLEVLKSPWLAVCLMGLLLLVRNNELTFYHCRCFAGVRYLYFLLPMINLTAGMLQVYLGDAEALHRSSLQMKAAGIEAVSLLNLLCMKHCYSAAQSPLSRHYVSSYNECCGRALWQSNCPF